MRILVVEDDVALREKLKTELVESGFGVDVIGDGAEALLAGLHDPPDGALVDLGMPSLSGLDIIRQWRRKGRGFPVLILTGRIGWENRIQGLKAGADDYVEKPYHIEEVITRIHCIIRRAHGWTSPEIVCGPFVLDTDRKTVCAHDKELELTTLEFRLLQILMLNAGKVLSTSALAESLYDSSADHESNTVAYFICRLRRKLDPSNQLDPIKTVYGGGYCFVIEGERQTTSLTARRSIIR